MAEKPEDMSLPTSIVAKIIKDTLPANCKVSKEANSAIAKAAGVFVLYTTTTANGLAQKSNRKTISGQDVIGAMSEMDFDKFVRPLEDSLALWKQSQKEKKSCAAAKKKAEAAASTAKDAEGGGAAEAKDDDDDVREVEPEKEKEKAGESKPTYLEEVLCIMNTYVPTLYCNLVL
uniref:DNA polymerase epsilon subunit 3 n=1 Tax=Acartia pacifica TaxID=335913 RepID=A0A0U2UNC8_ACAPC|nr:DNA polymerase epsilon subunit 3 [Acartia pacifica]